MNPNMHTNFERNMWNSLEVMSHRMIFHKVNEEKCKEKVLPWINHFVFVSVWNKKIKDKSFKIVLRYIFHFKVLDGNIAHNMLDY